MIREANNALVATTGFYAKALEVQQAELVQQRAMMDALGAHVASLEAALKERDELIKGGKAENERLLGSWQDAETKQRTAERSLRTLRIMSRDLLGIATEWAKTAPALADHASRTVFENLAAELEHK